MTNGKRTASERAGKVSGMKSFTTWADWAMNRGRVRNKQTGIVGNLVDWLPGKYAKVFTGYDRIGACSLPIFENWEKWQVEVESNEKPVTHS